jgi:hypothetical protein
MRRNAVGAHFPSLHNDCGEWRADNVAGMIAVQIDVHFAPVRRGNVAYPVNGLVVGHIGLSQPA